MTLHHIFYLAIAALLFSCSARPAEEGGELPEDVTQLRALKKDLESQIKETTARLDAVEAKIEEIEPRRKTSRLVTMEAIQLSDFNKYATIQGAVESKDLVSVSTETPGRLTSVTVDEGDPVRRGQLIATVDLENLRKQRVELETQLSLAKDVFVRQKRLWDQNIGSEIQYLEAKNSVERLEKSLETIDYSLTKSKIYAPITGVVDMVNLKSGELAQPGQPIVMILDSRNLEVVADVPESYLGKINRGETVEIRFPAIDEEMSRPVSLIGRKIDPTNRTFKVEVDINSNNGLIKPNLLAEMKINSYTEKDVMIVSQELIQEEVGGKKYVMIVDDSGEENVARKTYITTGESYEGDVVVLTGLEVGDRLITNGARGITDGELVEIINKEIAADGE